jgi:hypothetical protein
MAGLSDKKSFQQTTQNSSLIFNANDFMASEDPHLRAYEELKS